MEFIWMPKSQGQIITGVREEKRTLQQLMLPTLGWGSVYTYPSRPIAYKELTVATRTMFSVRASPNLVILGVSCTVEMATVT